MQPGTRINTDKRQQSAIIVRARKTNNKTTKQIKKNQDNKTNKRKDNKITRHKQLYVMINMVTNRKKDKTTRIQYNKTKRQQDMTLIYDNWDGHQQDNSKISRQKKDNIMQ